MAEPYISPKASDSVLKALSCHNVSSASEPVAQLGAALKTMYNKPVAQPCTNGFVSLLLAMQCHGIGKDAIVLVPTFTMVAVPNAVVFLGAIPAFADNEVGGYNPGVAEYLAAAERVDKSKIKAVITAHTYAVPSDIKGIVAMCKQNGWALIEDISEGVGGKFDGKYLGTLVADISIIWSLIFDVRYLWRLWLRQYVRKQGSHLWRWRFPHRRRSSRRKATLIHC